MPNLNMEPVLENFLGAYLLASFVSYRISVNRGRIVSCVRPFCERAVSDLDP